MFKEASSNILKIIKILPKAIFHITHTINKVFWKLVLIGVLILGYVIFTAGVKANFKLVEKKPDGSWVVGETSADITPGSLLASAHAKSSLSARYAIDGTIVLDMTREVADLRLITLEIGIGVIQSPASAPVPTFGLTFRF